MTNVDIVCTDTKAMNSLMTLIFMTIIKRTSDYLIQFVLAWLIFCQQV